MTAPRRTIYGALVTLTVAAVAAIGWYAWQNSRGVQAVIQLCRNDGGLHIKETAEAEGYLDLGGAYICVACMQGLGARQYSYVDFQYSRPTPLSDQPGYLRMSIANKEDPRCARYERAVAAGTISGQRYKLRADECFVVEPLDQRPVGFVYGRRNGTVVAPNGVTLGTDEIYVTDERDGRELAVSRNYAYLAPLAAWFDMSGGGGTAYATCDETAGVPFKLGFVDQVLLKKPIGETIQGIAQ